MFSSTGYNRWRDPMKPTQILARLCKEGKMELPVYGPNSVRIAKHTFTLSAEDNNTVQHHGKSFEEHLALAVLHRWQEFPRIGCQVSDEIRYKVSAFVIFIIPNRWFQNI